MSCHLRSDHHSYEFLRDLTGFLQPSSTQELARTAKRCQARPSDTCVLALLSQLSAELVLQPTVRQSHRGDTPQTHPGMPRRQGPKDFAKHLQLGFRVTCYPSIIALLHLVANYVWRNTKLQNRNEQGGDITTRSCSTYVINESVESIEAG